MPRQPSPACRSCDRIALPRRSSSRIPKNSMSVVSVFLSTLISHLLAVALMVAAAALWINQISFFLVLLPLYMLTVGLFAVGMGWIVASLHVFLRDTAQVLNVILTF